MQDATIQHNICTNRILVFSAVVVLAAVVVFADTIIIIIVIIAHRGPRLRLPQKYYEVIDITREILTSWAIRNMQIKKDENKKFFVC